MVLVLSPIAEHSGHPVRCHQGTAPQIDLNFDGATLLGETQFKQERLIEVLRHLSCEKVQARRVLSCHHLPTMEAKVDPIRSGGGRHCKVHSHHELGLQKNYLFLEHVVLIKDAEHDVQDLGDVFCQLTQNGRRAKTSLKCLRGTQSLNLTLTRTASILAGTRFRISCVFVQIPASRIWTAWHMSSEGKNVRDLQVMKQDGSLIKLRSISSAPSK